MLCPGKAVLDPACSCNCWFYGLL